jgi:7,8-dihydropterin-6-yl-methyl-4-(beta-D-ribofuranosyl)aminobenzene 5'-phosphate synthase
MTMKTTTLALLLACMTGFPAVPHAQPAQVKTAKVTVLSTMLSGNPNEGVGEWGFAALIETDGRRLLVDTGARADTVLRNAAELRVDLSTVTDLVLTHNHADHTGGLLTLRRELAKKNPQALSRAHVSRGIFLSRVSAQGRETSGLLPIKADYEALGGAFVEHDGPVQLLPGVWLTGPIPRVHPERNYGGVSGGAGPRLQTASGPAEDNVPEDSSVIIQSPAGLIVVTGCGHAGIVNTLDHARTFTKEPRVHAAIGGFHLFGATDEQLAWTAGKLRDLRVEHFLGAHCTGIEAVLRIRQATGLTRKTAAVGAVGATFELGRGLDARLLAQ